jgi:hypothetical protein
MVQGHLSLGFPGILDDGGVLLTFGPGAATVGCSGADGEKTKGPTPILITPVRRALFTGSNVNGDGFARRPHQQTETRT